MCRITASLRLAGLLILCLFVVPTAPAAAQPDPGHRFEVVTENGIPTALTRGGPRYEGDLFRYVEVLSIELESLKKRQRPVRPSAFMRTPDGRYCVVDSTQERHTIYIYGADGSYLDSFGREGDKPGQFASPVLQEIRGDTLVILDGGLDRITRLTIDGTLIDTLSVTRYRFPWRYQSDQRAFRQPFRAQAEREEAYRTQVTYPTEAWRLGNGGRLVLETSEWPRVNAVSRAAVYSAAGDTLAVFGTREVRSGTWAYYEQPMRMPAAMSGRGASPRGLPGGFAPGRMPLIRYKTTIFLPFAPLPMARYRPGEGILLSAGDEPVLTWYDLSGAPTRRIRIEADPEPVTDAVRERFEEDYRRYLTGLNEAERVAAQGRKNFLLLPRTRACWTWIHVDDAGYYWLRRHDEYVWQDSNTSHRYWILSPEGEFMGSTAAPPAFFTRELWQEWITPVTVSDGYFLTITRGRDEGEWTLTVYRLEPAAAGFSYPAPAS